MPSTESKKATDGVAGVPPATPDSRPFDELSEPSATPQKRQATQLHQQEIMQIKDAPPTAMNVMLAPSTRRSPEKDRNRTLLKEGETEETLEEGRQLIFGRDDMPSPPVKENEAKDAHPKAAAGGSNNNGEDRGDGSKPNQRGKNLKIGFVLCLVIALAAGLVGYLVLRDNEDGSNTSIFSANTNGGGVDESVANTNSPTMSPTMSPTVSQAPTLTPMPTDVPSVVPSAAPTGTPSGSPTFGPTGTPSSRPTASPSSEPTVSLEPTGAPSSSPTKDYVAMMEEFMFAEYGIDFGWDGNRDDDGDANANVLAVEWLAVETTRLAAAPNNQQSALDREFVQRFALLAMEFALLGPSGDGVRNALMGHDSCRWNGIVCNDDGFVTGVVWNYQMEDVDEKAAGGFIASSARLLADYLEVLDLSNNRLVGTIPEELYELTNLRKLHLFRNDLGGTISTKIGNLDSITHFHLSHNNLSGTIPSQIKSDNSGIRPLHYLNLYSNELTGTLPENMRLREAIYFDVGRNRLTGTLPDDIGEKFVSLRHFHLDHNEFEGTLPESYNTVGNGRLESFSIDHNKLTGTIEGERDLYNKLVQYTLHSNRFDKMDSDNCRLEVPQGEMVELRADCDVCRCNGYFDICDLQCFRG